MEYFPEDDNENGREYTEAETRPYMVTETVVQGNNQIRYDGDNMNFGTSQDWVKNNKDYRAEFPTLGGMTRK